jgi:hypothetical protein
MVNWAQTKKNNLFCSLFKIFRLYIKKLKTHLNNFVMMEVLNIEDLHCIQLGDSYPPARAVLL